MSWDQMLSIVSEAVEWKRKERTEPPIACPFDGEPLKNEPGGGPGKFCPLGNYEWPRQPRII